MTLFAAPLRGLRSITFGLVDDWRITAIALAQVAHFFISLFPATILPQFLTFNNVFSLLALSFAVFSSFHIMNTTSQIPTFQEVAAIQEKIRVLETQLHLHLYHDGTGLVDYASIGSGARIIPELTSETYSVSGQSTPWYGRWGKHEDALGLEGLPPDFAIVPHTHVGSCWPMKGRHGSLGISLARPTIITSFTIDHVPQDMSLQYQIAPRYGDLWGLMESVPPELDASVLTIVPLSEPSSIYPDNSRILRSRFSRSYLVHLGSFAFDVGYDGPFRTYSVSRRTRELLGDTMFGAVVLAIRGNWGSDDLTCLYRIRVHSDRRAETGYE